MKTAVEDSELYNIAVECEILKRQSVKEWELSPT